jgi:hypothetical protein
MERRECQGCERTYQDGNLIATDWPYWERTKTTLICPECRGIDVVKEMEVTMKKMGYR